MLFTLQELIDLVVMTLALGYIFMIYVQRPKTHLDMLRGSGFSWDDFKFALLATAPAVVFHELSHKFVALLLGLSATFHASYFGLGLGVLLRLVQSPFIAFIPGFVAISAATPLQGALTAFAGPGMNLALFLLATILLMQKKKRKYNTLLLLQLTKQINLFLFFFNMIPLQPFDGAQVFRGFFQTIF